MRTVLLSLVVAFLAGACTTDDELQRAGTEKSEAPATAATVPPEETSALGGEDGGSEAAESSGAASLDETVAKEDGASCASGLECASGICEGEGCTDDALGTCMPRGRMCTKDLRPYCGCDGVTFRDSGSCPMRRFQHRGPCEGGS